MAAVAAAAVAAVLAVIMAPAADQLIEPAPARATDYFSAAQIERGCRSAGLSLVELRRYADPGYFSFRGWTLSAAIVADWAVERLFGCGRIYFSATLQRPAAPAGAKEAYQ